MKRDVEAITCAIVVGAFVLAYAVWRLFERSPRRATQAKLIELAGRAGFEASVKLVQPARLG